MWAKYTVGGGASLSVTESEAIHKSDKNILRVGEEDQETYSHTHTNMHIFSSFLIQTIKGKSGVKILKFRIKVNQSYFFGLNILASLPYFSI